MAPCMAVPFSPDASSLSAAKKIRHHFQSPVSELLKGAEEEARRHSVPAPRRNSTGWMMIMMATLAPPPRRLQINQNQNPNQKIHNNGRYFHSESSRQEESDEASVTTTTIPFLLQKEVELPQWFVQEGDCVHQHDATLDMSHLCDGALEDLVGLAVGDMVATVGSPLLEEELVADAHY